MQSFRFNEKYLSQIPALQLLINLGYEYLSPPSRPSLNARAKSAMSCSKASSANN